MLLKIKVVRRRHSKTEMTGSDNFDPSMVGFGAVAHFRGLAPQLRVTANSNFGIQDNMPKVYNPAS